MKQVKFHRTELSLSVSGAEFCALSENRGLSLQKLQERQVLNEQLFGKGSKTRGTRARAHARGIHQKVSFDENIELPK